MNNTVKTAVGGMCIALSCAIMLCSSIIPVLTYAIPAIAAVIVLFVQSECNWKWALGVYFGTSVICAIVVPDKEAVAIYIALLGYYPVLKTLLDKPKKIISILIKSVYFVIIIICSYVIMIKLFGISTELLDATQRYMIPILVVSGLVTFLLYDWCLELFEIKYYRRWQKTVNKIFKKNKRR